MPPENLKANLASFVSFAQTLKGDEKSEAQSFLDQFFRALGHKSAIEAGATFEFRVAKKPASPQLELIQGNGASPLIGSLAGINLRDARETARCPAKSISPFLIVLRDRGQDSATGLARIFLLR